MTKVPTFFFFLAQKIMLENRINGKSEYKSGSWQVQNNKRSKEFERSSSEIKKMIARNILNNSIFQKKNSINNLNHFQSY